MLGLDHNGVYLLSAFGISLVVLVVYALYLRSRLQALRRRAAPSPGDYSGRNVSAAAPMPTTAQAASSAKGPTAP